MAEAVKKFTDAQKRALRKIEEADEDIADIWQGIARLVGQPLLPDRVAVLQQYPDELGQLTTAFRRRDTAMRAAVREDLYTYPYKLAQCTRRKRPTHNAARCQQCRRRAGLLEAARKGFIGYPCVLEWVGMCQTFHSDKRRQKALHALSGGKNAHPELERGRREQPIWKHYAALAAEVYRLLENGKSWSTIFTATNTLREHAEREAMPKGEKAPKHRSPWALQKWAMAHRLCTKAIPRKLRDLVRSIAPPESKIVPVIWPEEDEDYNIAVVVPDAIPYDEARQLEARLLCAFEAYDDEQCVLTICRVWCEREWEVVRKQIEQVLPVMRQLVPWGVPLDEGLTLGVVEKLVTQGATLQETLEQLHPVLQAKKGSKKPSRALS